MPTIDVKKEQRGVMATQTAATAIWGQSAHRNNLSKLLDPESSTPSPIWMTESPFHDLSLVLKRFARFARFAVSFSLLLEIISQAKGRFEKPRI